MARAVLFALLLFVAPAVRAEMIEFRVDFTQLTTHPIYTTRQFFATFFVDSSILVPSANGQWYDFRDPNITNFTARLFGGVGSPETYYYDPVQSDAAVAPGFPGLLFVDQTGSVADIQGILRSASQPLTNIQIGRPAGTYFDIQQVDRFNSVVVTSGTYTISRVTPVVPLPAAGWLFLSGMAGLGAMSRRKRRNPV